MAKQWLGVTLSFMLSLSMAAMPAHAQEQESEGSEAGLDVTLRTKAAAMPIKTLDNSQLDSPASHIYLLDYDTGTVLADRAGDQKMYPSSMTKIMTLYLIFERLKQNTLSLDSQFTVSEKAWRMQGSKMFVPIGQQVKLEDLIRGIAIQSGNDACIVVAEGIAGSESAFAKLMNDKAKALGMTGTNYVDSNGWPDPKQLTTPQDLAILAAAIVRDFPEYHHYHSEREYTYHGIRQFNRNLLLGNPSLHVDGLKTGHTDAAGYGITLTATDPATKRREILVINGLDSEADRAQEGEHLLKWGFANFTNFRAFAANSEITKAKVWGGANRQMGLTVAKDAFVTLPKTADAKAIKASVEYASPLIAPITKGQQVGKLILTSADGSAHEFPLVAAEATEKVGFLARALRVFGI